MSILTIQNQRDVARTSAMKKRGSARTSAGLTISSRAPEGGLTDPMAAVRSEYSQKALNGYLQRWQSNPDTYKRSIF